jgi:hypothetical protein
MNIRIQAAQAGEIKLSPVLQPPLKQMQLPDSICYGATGSFGYVLFQQLDGDGVSVLYHTLYFNNDERVTFSSDMPALRLQIILRNSYFYESKEFGTGALHERGISLHAAPSIHTVIRLRRQENYSHLSIYYT